MRNRLLIPVVVLVLAVGFPRPAGAAALTAHHLMVHATFRILPTLPLRLTTTAHEAFLFLTDEGV